jgi:hypothetical protein
MSAQTLPFDSSITPATPVPDLTVAGMQFYKRGGFTVNETIAYEQYTNGYAHRSLELMALGQRISVEKEMTYAQVIDILGDSSAVEMLLGEYIEDILAIGLDRFSEAQRKADIATLFIQSRCNPAWTKEQTGDLLFTEAEQIYIFTMGEYRGWKAPAPEPTDAELGKSSPTSAAPSTTRSTGRKSTTTSKAVESATPDTKDLTSVVS